MQCIIQVAIVVGIGLLATACDKCGNWNLNTPQFCRGSSSPQG